MKYKVLFGCLFLSDIGASDEDSIKVRTINTMTPERYAHVLNRAAQAREYLKKKFPQPKKEMIETAVVSVEITQSSIISGSFRNDQSSLDDYSQDADRFGILKIMMKDFYAPEKSDSLFRHYRTYRGCSSAREVIFFIRTLNQGCITIPHQLKHDMVEKITEWYPCDKEQAILFWQRFSVQEKVNENSSERIIDIINRKYF